MFVFPLALAFLHNVVATLAITHTFDWNITWTTANPDGALDRPVIGINEKWPLPVLNFTKGDRVVANVYNAVHRSQQALS